MTMKRTKNINQNAFRKSWRSYRLAPVAVAVSAVFILSACEESDETVSLYTNAQDCSQANPSQAEQCTLAYNNALQEAAKTAPKYATQADCIAEFGESMCTQAPAQAGIAGTSSTSGEQTAQAQSGGGSMWMPLMMGYMMGRMMGGGAASQPLFSSKNPASPANGKFVDSTGKSYGPATAGGRSISVPKTAMAPKPPTTSTVTRGGFGDSVNKQAMAQRSSSSSKSTSSRSMGG